MRRRLAVLVAVSLLVSLAAAPTSTASATLTGVYFSEPSLDAGVGFANAGSPWQATWEIEPLEAASSRSLQELAVDWYDAPNNLRTDCRSASWTPGSFRATPTASDDSASGPIPSTKVGWCLRLRLRVTDSSGTVVSAESGPLYVGPALSPIGTADPGSSGGPGSSPGPTSSGGSSPIGSGGPGTTSSPTPSPTPSGDEFASSTPRPASWPGPNPAAKFIYPRGAPVTRAYESFVETAWRETALPAGRTIASRAIFTYTAPATRARGCRSKRLTWTLQASYAPFGSVQTIKLPPAGICLTVKLQLTDSGGAVSPLIAGGIFWSSPTPILSVTVPRKGKMVRVPAGAWSTIKIDQSIPGGRSIRSKTLTLQEVANPGSSSACKRKTSAWSSLDPIDFGRNETSYQVRWAPGSRCSRAQVTIGDSADVTTSATSGVFYVRDATVLDPNPSSYPMRPGTTTTLVGATEVGFDWNELPAPGRTVKTRAISLFSGTPEGAIDPESPCSSVAKWVKTAKAGAADSLYAPTIATGTCYFMTVRAKDSAGIWSATLTSGQVYNAPK